MIERIIHKHVRMQMPSQETIYGLHKLEVGKRYVAFPSGKDGQWVGTGVVVNLAQNSEFVIIEQSDGSLAVLNWFQLNGVKIHFHLMKDDERLEDVPLIVTSREDAWRASLTLMGAPNPIGIAGSLSMIMRPCPHNMWYFEEPVSEDSISLGLTTARLFYGEDGRVSAHMIRRLLEMADQLCIRHEA